MTKKTRLIILLVCVACFLVISPVIIFYAEGYRFDFKKMILTETGGIYVRSFPSADQITVDSKITEKPGLFSNSIFVQSLIPEEHTVLVKKENYYDYYKNIPVVKKEVTKLENILLIKKNILFSIVPDPITPSVTPQSPFIDQNKFIIKNNSLYYSNVLENAKLTTVQKSTPVLKKLVAFSLQNNNIIWLGTDGFVYRSEQTNLSLAPTKITSTAIKISKTGNYKIISDDKDIFLNDNGKLVFFNEKTNNLDNFYSPIKDAKISPDGLSIVYYNDNNVYISLIPTNSAPAIIKNNLYESKEKLSNLIWLNNSYIIFTTEPQEKIGQSKIIISEIDYRGNINSVTLPQTITVFDQKINLEKPQIYFNQQESKLYILTNKILIVSEKIGT